jgi:hypothetical protein
MARTLCLNTAYEATGKPNSFYILDTDIEYEFIGSAQEARDFANLIQQGNKDRFLAEVSQYLKINDETPVQVFDTLFDCTDFVIDGEMVMSLDIYYAETSEAYVTLEDILAEVGDLILAAL